MINPKYTATLCLEIDGSGRTPVIRRAFVIGGQGDEGDLVRQTQPLGKFRVFVSVAGVTHGGDTFQQAEDAALAFGSQWPWILALLSGEDADQVPGAIARHKKRMGFS